MLGFKEKASFASGDFALNLYWQIVSTYLLFFYTDYVGLGPAVAGMIYMAASIWDAVTDPAMGVIADRTHSRWGSYRPYILFGSIPLAISFCLMLYQPDLEGVGLIAWVAATHMLFRTCYTVVSIPYTTLGGRLSTQAEERTSIAAYRMVLATTAGVIVTTQTLYWVDILSETQRQGFLYVALIYAIVATMTLVFCFRSISEHSHQIVDKAVDKPGLGEILHALRINRPFLILLLAICLSVFSLTTFLSTLVYYVKYDLLRPDLIGVVFGMKTGISMLSLPFWTWLVKKSSKRSVWWVAAMVYILGLLALFALPSSQVTLILVILGFVSFAYGAFTLNFWGMLPDTIEYSQLKTGVRADSVVFGLAQFVLKTSIGIGAGALGYLLGFVGYEANIQQSADTLSGMRNILVVVPVLLQIGACLVLLAYPISNRSHARMVQKITDG